MNRNLDTDLSGRNVLHVLVAILETAEEAYPAKMSKGGPGALRVVKLVADTVYPGFGGLLMRAFYFLGMNPDEGEEIKSVDELRKYVQGCELLLKAVEEATL